MGANEIVCDYAKRFIQDHFDRIDHDKINLEDSNLPTTKGKLLKVVGSDPQIAVWVITELRWWGMKDEFEELYVDTLNPDADYTVLGLDGNFVRLEIAEDYKYIISIAKKKTKKVTYYE